MFGCQKLLQREKLQKGSTEVQVDPKGRCNSVSMEKGRVKRVYICETIQQIKVLAISKKRPNNRLSTTDSYKHKRIRGIIEKAKCFTVK